MVAVKIIAQSLKWDPSAFELFSVLIGTVALSWSALCLLGGRISGGGYRTKMARTVAILLFSGVVVSFGFDGLSFSERVVPVLLLIVAGSLAITAGLSMACLRNRKEFSSGWFTLSFFMWTIISFTGILFVFLGIGMVIDPHLLRQGLSIAGRAVLIGGLMGSLLALFSLPFIILLLSSTFYRHRLLTCFQLAEVKPERSEGP